MAQAQNKIEDIDIEDLLAALSYNPTGWGPTSFQETFEGFPYSPFSKSDKIGRVADFIGKEHARVTGKGGYNYRDDRDDRDKFNLVDTTRTKTTRTPTFRGRWNRRRQQPVRRTEPSNKKELKGKQLKYISQHTRRGKQWKRPRNTGYRRRNNRHIEASVKISADWEVVEQFDLNTLSKMQIQPPEATDLKVTGSLCTYNDVFDKITTRTSVKLDKDRFHTNVYPTTTTSDDTTMIGFAREAAAEKKENPEKAFVFCTDELMTQIMVSTRSGFPWDLVLTRLDNDIVLVDKREESKIHLETVNESAQPLTEEEENNLAEYNKKNALAEEATNINQLFRQQCLRYKKKKMFSTETPLLDEYEPESDEEPEITEARKNLSIAYRYRKFALGPIDVYVRTELHAIVKQGGKKNFATIFSFNEWDSRVGQTIEWRPKIDNQKGVIIATELKNNSYKIGKWTAKTLLAGAETMRFGFVSRKAKTDNNNHIILGTHQLDPNALAAQVNLRQKNMWGIFKAIIDIVLKGETGKYVLLKDPNRPILRLYKMPIDEEVEGNEDDMDNDEEEDN